MQLSHTLAILAVPTAGLLAWAAAPDGNPLRAGGSGLVALADTDGDGLDDALEARLRTNPDQPDTDGDGYTDLEEALLASDPLLNEGASLVPEARLLADTYALGDFVYIQAYALHQRRLSHLGAAYATETRMLTLPARQLRAYMVKRSVVPAPSLNGWRIASLTLRIPRFAFERPSDSAFGVRGIVDGLFLDAQVLFTNLSATLTQVREIEPLIGGRSAPGQSGGGSTGAGGEPGSGVGGLFPVDPDGGSPPGTPEEVCIQVLAPVGTLGPGRVLYEVTNASCQTLPGAVCFSTCAATVGDTIVVIDIVGLLGG